MTKTEALKELVEQFEKLVGKVPECGMTHTVVAGYDYEEQTISLGYQGMNGIITLIKRGQ